MYSIPIISPIKRSVRGTHSELTDPHLRAILANELLILRSIAQRAKKRGHPMDPAYIFGAQIGLDTFARRVEDVQKNGIKEVYAQNYPKEIR